MLMLPLSYNRLLIVQTFFTLIQIVSSFANIQSPIINEKKQTNNKITSSLQSFNNKFSFPIIDSLTFSSAKKLMELGHKQKIEVKDVLKLGEYENITSISGTFEKILEEETRLSDAIVDNKPYKRSLAAFVFSPISRSIAKM